MSIFDLTPNDFQEYAAWISSKKSHNEELVQTLSQFYSFDFKSGEPIPDGKFDWNVCERKLGVYIRHSSVSTVHTLGDDTTTIDQIPSIDEASIRLSRDPTLTERR